MVTLNDIQKGLAHIDLANKSAQFSGRIDRIQERNIELVGVDYFFNIIDTAIAYPQQTWFNQLRDNAATRGDTILPFLIEDMQHGIDLCRDFCADNNLPFTQGDEANLRNEVKNLDSNGLYLIIHVRPIQKG
ncbi:MAG: hypothetical protein K9G49_16730 [Taibaiella sp.]|nr:hypothetical protein [Taibaiella sp.]